MPNFKEELKREFEEKFIRSLNFGDEKLSAIIMEKDSNFMVDWIISKIDLLLHSKAEEVEKLKKRVIFEEYAEKYPNDFINLEYKDKDDADTDKLNFGYNQALSDAQSIITGDKE